MKQLKKLTRVQKQALTKLKLNANDFYLVETHTQTKTWVFLNSVTSEKVNVHYN